MEKKEYLSKLSTLNLRLQTWLNEDYVPKCMKDERSFKYNALHSALVLSWYDAISICIDSFVDGDFEEDNMPFDVDDYLEFFTEHTLEECANTFFMFSHPDRFDPFGFSDDGFFAQIEVINIIVEEIKKENIKE